MFICLYCACFIYLKICYHRALFVLIFFTGCSRAKLLKTLLPNKSCMSKSICSLMATLKGTFKNEA